MANYVLTQTGQEVQDILDSMGATYFFSQTATFASDNTYADYPYKGTISLVGVDGTMGVEVSFSNDQAISGNYSPICNTTNDAVEIWSKVNTSITIPTIKIYKNGYVNLNGSSNYMPQSGGNFTGMISVNSSNVVLQSDLAVTNVSLTRNTATTDSGTITCYKWGKFCTIRTSSLKLSASATGTWAGIIVATGCPLPYGNVNAIPSSAMTIDGASADCFLSVNVSGQLVVNVRGTAMNGKTLMGSIEYITA